MKVNFKKVTNRSLFFNNKKYFKQFNIYENIRCKEYYINKFLLIKNRYYCFREPMKIDSVDSTIPTINIKSTKVINTVEGSSLGGQYLSGKKLHVIGEINLSLVVGYCCKNKIKYAIEKIKIPFSTFIIIPKEICNIREVNLRYLIEDVTIEHLGDNIMLVSVTTIIEYLDEYIDSKVL